MGWTRRQCLRAAWGAILAAPWVKNTMDWSSVWATPEANNFTCLRSGPTMMNDVHSQLNPTRVAEVYRPTCSSETGGSLIDIVQHAAHPISIGGQYHAMGGQQLAKNSSHLDTRDLNKILQLDRDAGLVIVEAGITWADLITGLQVQQQNQELSWAIVQKPTGADRISIGGSVSANVHGRGLGFAPFIQDIESIQLITPEGTHLSCGRDHHPGLFHAVVGGYGMFGLIHTVTLRLQRRQKMRRAVSIVQAPVLMESLDTLRQQGAVYGDFQPNIDPDSPGFLSEGILSVYEPVGDETPMPETQRVLSEAQWMALVQDAHTRPGIAYGHYRDHYLKTHGQLYWNDTMQLGPYLPQYHRQLKPLAGETAKTSPGSEMITELYVPRERYAAFIQSVSDAAQNHHWPIIYSTTRLIEPDTETLLPWARQPYACIIFNLHTDHTRQGMALTRRACRALIDLALAQGGSFYLTYHRWATADQVLAAYPMFPEWLRFKREWDKDERFQSDWYRHYRRMFL